MGLTALSCSTVEGISAIYAPEHYNDYAWEKFDRVMKAAKAQDLKVMLRVGYTWDYYSSENVLARYEKLLYDSETKEAWLHYAKVV